jgi:hypothetical protein
MLDESKKKMKIGRAQRALPTTGLYIHLVACEGGKQTGTGGLIILLLDSFNWLHNFVVYVIFGWSFPCGVFCDYFMVFWVLFGEF